VAAVYEPTMLTTVPERIAFENHLNFFHEAGAPLPLDLARGLALYLNSTLVDTYFRQFSGHTQVNAADLRNMPYPSRKQLEAAGAAVTTSSLAQEETDRVVEDLFLA
jgi:adenine-specific DNA-methyltransferase